MTKMQAIIVQQLVFGTYQAMLFESPGNIVLG